MLLGPAHSMFCEPLITLLAAGRPSSLSPHRELGMASFLRLTPVPHLHASWQPRRRPSRGVRDIRCDGRSPSDGGSKSENAVLRLAWYGSELLGVAASVFRPSPSAAPSEELRADGLGFATGRAEVAGAIKEDFARSYFVTGSRTFHSQDFRLRSFFPSLADEKGRILNEYDNHESKWVLAIVRNKMLRQDRIGNLTLEAYEDDCEFADPAGSFRGLRRFKRNCTNFGSLLEKSSMKLTKWEDFELLAIQNTISMLNQGEFAGNEFILWWKHLETKQDANAYVQYMDMLLKRALVMASTRSKIDTEPSSQSVKRQHGGPPSMKIQEDEDSQLELLMDSYLPQMFQMLPSSLVGLVHLFFLTKSP
ncbi:hypothetical protein MUK42_21364 [Musa troglodytarum]|uniref:Uncharacterized protein n=1 Tax=Musa troglodytarum TaxID=320322 RepID=A0A9E7K5W2_9LILI|nr:hypothetical protein MUK42_21364 [Musa troglodytarum]